eukprot:scaffold109998_cov59-Phaeocystis_antarctica.AAC.1
MQARKPSPLVDDNLVYAQFSHCEAPIECNEAPNGYSRGARKSQSHHLTPMISLNHAREPGPDWLTPTADRASPAEIDVIFRTRNVDV